MTVLPNKAVLDLNISLELWRYRHLEGIGENIEIEFVDATGSAEIPHRVDPCEKDRAPHVPGAGSSLSELLGRSSKASFHQQQRNTCPMPLGGQFASTNEFEAMDRYSASNARPSASRIWRRKSARRIVIARSHDLIESISFA